MSKLLLPVLCLCLAAWLFGGSIWFGNNYGEETTSDSVKTWELRDGDTKFVSPTRFAFQLSDPEILLDDNQLAIIGQIAQYMETHSDRNLKLTGLYSDEKEINNSDYPNLGIARAESFRYLLYRQGINLDRIQIHSSNQNELPLNENGLIDEGVQFEFFESPFKKYGPSFKTEKEIFFNGDEDISLKDSLSLDSYLASLRQYLADHPTEHIQLTGFSRTFEQNTITRKRVYHIEKLIDANGIEEDRVKFQLANFDEKSVQKPVNSYVEIRILQNIE